MQGMSALYDRDGKFVGWDTPVEAPMISMQEWRRRDLHKQYEDLTATRKFPTETAADRPSESSKSLMPPRDNTGR